MIISPRLLKSLKVAGSKVAKETVYGKPAKEAKKQNYTKEQPYTADRQNEGKSYYKCDRTNHTADEYRLKTATCNYCFFLFL